MTEHQYLCVGVALGGVVHSDLRVVLEGTRGVEVQGAQLVGVAGVAEGNNKGDQFGEYGRKSNSSAAHPTAFSQAPKKEHWALVSSGNMLSLQSRL
jgi:hypothetical protein